MSQVKEPKLKDLNVKHHKLGDIKLGKIPNNEKCRMIYQLMQERQQLNQQLTAASLLLQKIPKRTMEKYKKQVQDDLEKAKNDVSKNNKPANND